MHVGICSSSKVGTHTVAAVIVVIHLHTPCHTHTARTLAVVETYWDSSAVTSTRWYTHTTHTAVSQRHTYTGGSSITAAQTHGCGSSRYTQIHDTYHSLAAAVRSSVNAHTVESIHWHTHMAHTCHTHRTRTLAAEGANLVAIVAVIYWHTHTAH